MKNYTNVRIEGLSNNNFVAMLDHNLRKDTTRNQSKNDNNVVIKFDKDNNTFETFETQLLSTREQKLLSEDELNEYKNKRHNMLNYRQELLHNYSENREEHKQLYKKRTRTQLKDDVASWGNGIITFSEKIQNDYNNGLLNKEQFYKCAFNSVSEICKTLKATPELCVVHFDETTPHIHFMFKNYDEKGKSLSNNFNLKKRQKDENLDKPILEQLQDIGASSFAPFGVERGVNKLLSNHRHTTTQQYHLQTIKTQEDLIRQNEAKLLEQQQLQSKINEDKAKYEAELQEKYRELENQLRQNLINNNQHLFANYDNVDIEKLSKLLEDLSQNERIPEDIRDAIFENCFYKKQTQEDRIDFYNKLDSIINNSSNNTSSNHHNHH